MVDFLVLFSVEAVAFLLATLNFRFCAKGHIRATVWSDVLIAFNSFFLIKFVGDATSTAALVGYVSGAAVGSFVGMRLTKGLEEHEQ